MTVVATPVRAVRREASEEAVVAEEAVEVVKVVVVMWAEAMEEVEHLATRPMALLPHLQLPLGYVQMED